MSVRGAEDGRPAAEVAIPLLKGFPVPLSVFYNSILNLVTLTVFSTPGQETPTEEAKESMTLTEAIAVPQTNSVLKMGGACQQLREVILSL